MTILNTAALISLFFAGAQLSFTFYIMIAVQKIEYGMKVKK